MPLVKLICDTAHAVVEALGLEQRTLVEGLASIAARDAGNAACGSSLHSKEVPLNILPQNRHDPE
jgi:hypothetical protein